MNTQKNNKTPVSHEDAELIFKLLDIVTDEIHRLFEFGATLDESTEEYELERLQSKIASKQDEIRRLRSMISKTRQFISHRKTIQKQSNR